MEGENTERRGLTRRAAMAVGFGALLVPLIPRAKGETDSPETTNLRAALEENVRVCESEESAECYAFRSTVAVMAQWSLTPQMSATSCT